MCVMSSKSSCGKADFLTARAGAAFAKSCAKGLAGPGQRRNGENTALSAPNTASPARSPVTGICMHPHTLISAASGFESAAQVTLLPVGHRSRGLHGHSYLATVRTALPAGWAPFPGSEVEALRARMGETVAPLDSCAAE
jgi:hypothetical protein